MKAREKEELSESIADIFAPTEVTQASSLINFARKYMWAISNVNLDAAKKLGPNGIQKYWKRAGQVEIELDWLYNWILALATFVSFSRRVYDNEEVTMNMNVG